MSTRITSAHGISLISVGAGKPIIWLHGIGGSAESCADAARLLADRGYRCFSWDAPGYGQSADPVGAVDLPQLVIDVLDDLGLDRAVVFGTSWGGVIATQLAVRFPERVQALVLADSTRGSGLTPQRAAAMRGRIADLERLGAADFAASRASRLVAPNANEHSKTAVLDMMSRVRLPGYTVAADFMADSDTGPILERIACPTLVLVGEHDVITGVAESQLLAQRIPGARFALVADAGHAAVTERPEAVAQLVHEFLESQ